MIARLSPAGWSLVVIGVVVLLALIVVLRVAMRDRGIRGIRVGVFYERERDDGE